MGDEASEAYAIGRQDAANRFVGSIADSDSEVDSEYESRTGRRKKRGNGRGKKPHGKRSNDNSQGPQGSDGKKSNGKRKSLTV